MSDYLDLEANCIPVTISPSTAGGVARHFRVQYRSDVDATWRWYANYDRPDRAHQCLQHLKRKGFAVRLVHYAIFPAVA